MLQGIKFWNKKLYDTDFYKEELHVNICSFKMAICYIVVGNGSVIDTESDCSLLVTQNLCKCDPSNHKNRGVLKGV